MAKKKVKRKFAKVPKTKRGVPKKYVSGAKDPSARESEILQAGQVASCHDGCDIQEKSEWWQKKR